MVNIEEAVRTRILEQSTKDAKAQNSGLDPEVIEDAIDEAFEYDLSR
jgi:hypothetical protein